MVSHIPRDSLIQTHSHGELKQPPTQFGAMRGYGFKDARSGSSSEAKPQWSLYSPTLSTEIRKESKAAPTNSMGWATEKLRPLGIYHPLDPSHVSIPRAQLADALERLSDSFRRLSCHVAYEESYLSAACHTMEQVQFQVSLYESREDAQMIFLELQRRAGDSCIYYQEYVHPILAVVTGQSMPVPRRCSLDRLPAASLDRLAKLAGMEEDDVDVAIELTTNLVTSDRIDARRLGLESLEVMTDLSKTGWSTASKVARSIVLPEDETSQRLSQVMLGYLMSTDSGDLPYRALQVWSNTWQVAAEDPETALESFCERACPADILVNTLMTRVEGMQDQPHEATLALVGLTALCREMPHLRTSISRATVEHANVVGTQGHAALAQASGKFLAAR
jgi:hypothetical protein